MWKGEKKSKKFNVLFAFRLLRNGGKDFHLFLACLSLSLTLALFLTLSIRLPFSLYSFWEIEGKNNFFFTFYISSDIFPLGDKLKLVFFFFCGQKRKIFLHQLWQAKCWWMKAGWKKGMKKKRVDCRGEKIFSLINDLTEKFSKKRTKIERKKKRKKKRIWGNGWIP